MDPVDWRAMFWKYTDIVGAAEGVDFLYPSDWTAEEWEALCVLGEEQEAAVLLRARHQR